MAGDSTPCRGMACSSDLLGRVYMPRVPWHDARVHVAHDGGGREWLAQG